MEAPILIRLPSSQGKKEGEKGEEEGRGELGREGKKGRRRE